MSTLTSLAINQVQKRVTDVNFNINLFLHFLILFSFLSVFFIFFISKVSTDAFNNEVEHLIHELLSDRVKELKQTPEFDEVIRQLPLKKLYESFQKKTKAVEIHNDNLIKLVVIINILLWILFISMTVLLKYECNSNLNIGEIVIENLIIFAFVGLVEYYFFTRIALKFIPVEPSFISKQFMNSLKDKLR